MVAIFQLINLVLLIGIIVFFSRKKLSSYFSNQRFELEKSMKTAVKDLEAIQAEYEDIKEKTDHLETHLQEMRDDARYSLDREIRKIKDESQAFVEKFSKDAALRMNHSFDEAKRTVEKELIEIAVAAARVKLASRFEKVDEEWTQQMLQSTKIAGGEKNNYAS